MSASSCQTGCRWRCHVAIPCARCAQSAPCRLQSGTSALLVNWHAFVRKHTQLGLKLHIMSACCSPQPCAHSCRTCPQRLAPCIFCPGYFQSVAVSSAVASAPALALALAMKHRATCDLLQPCVHSCGASLSRRGMRSPTWPSRCCCQNLHGLSFSRHRVGHDLSRRAPRSRARTAAAPARGAAACRATWMPAA